MIEIRWPGWASEAPIYGRFGYAVATHRRSVRIDRRLDTFDQQFAAPTGSVHLVPGDDPGLIALIGTRWDRYCFDHLRSLVPCSSSRTRARWLTLYRNHDGEPAQIAANADGRVVLSTLDASLTTASTEDRPRLRVEAQETSADI